jgi:alkylated DNA repair dioxygenase AlkB
MKQANFFSSDQHNPIAFIPGLTYIAHYITPEKQLSLLSKIDQQPWMNDFKRRVQHYGYKYDYKARGIDQSTYLGSMPVFLTEMCQKLKNDGYFSSQPDQVIVNEYLPGQGISAHIDCIPCFKDIIASLSLDSDSIMEFTQSKTNQKESILLEEGSLVVLSGPARYDWQHAIPARKSDIINGNKVMRQRRVSLTFRNTILT